MLNKSLEIDGRKEIAVSKCDKLLEKITLEVGRVQNRKKFRQCMMGIGI